MNIETEKEFIIEAIDEMQKSQSKKEIDMLYKDLFEAIWNIYDYKVIEYYKRQGIV